MTCDDHHEPIRTDTKIGVAISLLLVVIVYSHYGCSGNRTRVEADTTVKGVDASKPVTANPQTTIDGDGNEVFNVTFQLAGGSLAIAGLAGVGWLRGGVEGRRRGKVATAVFDVVDEVEPSVIGVKRSKVAGTVKHACANHPDERVRRLIAKEVRKRNRRLTK